MASRTQTGNGEQNANREQLDSRLKTTDQELSELTKQTGKGSSMKLTLFGIIFVIVSIIIMINRASDHSD